MIYFLACGLVVVLGIVGYWVLPHIDFVQHWALKEGKAKASYTLQAFLSYQVCIPGNSLIFSRLS